MKKLWNKISLRTRITLLTGVIILTISTSLTLTSIQNASIRFSTILRPDKIILESRIENKEWYDNYEIIADNDIITLDISAAQAQAVQTFNIWSIVFLILFLIIGMALAWILAGQALAPLQRLETAISNISAQNLSARLSLPITQDEVGRLTYTFNDMLNRLEESFQQQKRFSSSVAHELKTPLTTMKMSLQVARLENQTDNELLTITERNVDRLIGVVNSLLNLTNESIEKLDEHVFLSSLLQEIVKELTPLYQDKHLQVEYNFMEEDSSVIGNTLLIHRLFGNLIENSMKYNKIDGKISISLKRKTDGKLQILIEDTGIGIPVSELSHIFEPFYCIDPSRSRHMGGAGLGLSIALAYCRTA